MHKDNHTHHHHHHHHYRDGDSQREYPFRAGEPGPGPNPHRLRRNTRDGKVAGVCVGVANYFGWKTKHVRLAFILTTVFFFPMPIFIYGGLAFLIPPDRGSRPGFASTEEERFWRTYSVKPRATFSELKHRFRAIDARISEMEKVVTSPEYRLRSEFRDLEQGSL
ncbi:MAG: PspC domain-containing protein [Pseudomonadota bacterium]